jgi:ABC-type branched-subunit amino acid transport system ATPase component
MDLLVILSGLALGATYAGVAKVYNLTFVEIARSLMHARSFILLDEPAELEHLVRVIDGLRALGPGVLPVEHHTNLVFV